MEGKLGVYAKNLQTNDQIAINADQPYPAGALRAPIDLDTKRAESRPPAAESPRALFDALKQRYLSLPRDVGDPVRRALICNSGDALLGTCMSPTIEIGAATSGIAKSPAVLGYAATTAGDVLFCVMASDLGSAFTGPSFFPEVIDAVIRRLVPGFLESPPEAKAPGLLLASIHALKQDPKLFPSAPDAAIADVRRGVQLLSFSTGDTARVAVLARAENATRVTVQWWSPEARAESRPSQVLSGRQLSDVFFDLPLTKLGSWRVRVAFGDTVVMDEKFFVTAK